MHSSRIGNRALLFLLLLALPHSVGGRLAEYWDTEKVMGRAELVVIARAVSTKDTSEKTKLPDLKVNVTGVETEFDTCLVLKGPKTINRFRFHYYKEDQETFTNGPLLVGIPRDQHPFYLLFLVKERDGRYTSASDQIDPADTSVFRLRGATGPRPPPDPIVGTGERRSTTDQSWTYQTMFDKADLVVQAKWTKTKATDERRALPDFIPWMQVIGVTTDFEIEWVFKGPSDVKNVALHHYRLEDRDDDLWHFSPRFVRVRVPQTRDGDHYPGGGEFLLFLKREADGRYAPVTGQIDPAVTSVLLLDFPSAYD